MSMQERIESKLRAALSPSELRLEDDSAMHGVPPGSETHWNLVVVSSAFEGRGLVDRHRDVYAALGDELRQGIHALAMKTLTPAEWDASGQQADGEAPPCLGGSKSQ